MEMYLYVLSFCLLIGLSSAAECDVAVVVVASIFGTLAVVLLVLGIIGFLLWKRRKGLLSVKSNSTPNTKSKKGDAGLLNESGLSPTREGHVNPAFNNESGMISMEEGNGGFKDFTSPDRTKSPSNKDANQKTWASLPGNDFSSSTFNRQGSCGSLDDNYLNVDPEITSVWLQSQDFIGLGFNISGNMRDGIFVSHVHNRGPAIESNKVKIGDKILSVTISFENIVYEDALTILSYASPYPVKVTLQKEKVMGTDRRSSLTNEALSHPLYRSQSLDALQRVGKDSFKPKRTFSEMKSDSRRDSSLRKELSNGVSDNCEGLTSTPMKVTDKTVEGSNFQVSDFLVHKAEDSGLVSDNKVSLNLSRIGMDKQEFDISGVKNKMDDVSVDMKGKARDELDGFKTDMTGKIDGVSSNVSGQATNKLNDFGVPSDISSQVTSGVNSQISDVKVKAGQKLSHEVTAVRTPDERKSSNAREFANLMDEMLDLNQSSDEPFSSMEVKNISNGSLIVEDSFNASVSTENQMSPPTKPTRKKKRSSTASNSSDEISLSQSDIKIDLNKRKPQSVVEDLMTITKVKDVSAAPPSGEMIEEDSIVAEKKLRDIIIPSDKIEFAAKEKESNQTDLPSPTLLRKILLDGMDDIKLNKEPEPDGEPVEEEMIQAVKVSREDAAPPLPRIVRSEEDGKPGKRTGINNNLNDIDDDLIDEIIAMNSRPIELAGLPGRNTKENFGGVSYDIQVADLDKIENKLRSEIEKDGPKSPTGGKAFEIREDLSGNLVNVDITKSNISRTVSEALIPPHTSNHDSDDDMHIQILRAGSLKEDKHHIKNDLDWSGKRLIRSGEFSEIPQDNSVKDFTDQNNISDGGETDINHKKVVIPISEDLKQELINKSLDLTNMSDISSSNSPSSTRSASPITTTNGPPELSPLALKKVLDFPSSESYSSSSRTGSYSFTLINKSGDEEDAEC